MIYSATRYRCRSVSPILEAARGLAKVFFEWLDPDALDGFIVAVPDIKLAAALRVAEILPVGRLVAGAGEARLLDEGFQQHGVIGVAGAPVLGQASTGQGEHTRGEVLHVDPR